MKNKCTKCGKELYTVYDFGLCYECSEKQDKFMTLLTFGGIILFFVILGGIRLLWAKFVYHDYRCAFGECRIIK